ncbi:hypothetical protein DXU07_31540 [Bradyrhizobium elkanii]|nr:hypothetical protein [Bradyrhizobium elkanii]OIM95120.1 hypothetical protein BLN97_06910 [Bradyrhizobium elkanii]
MGCLVVLGLIAPVSAQTRHPAPSAEAVQQRVLTGKERLGRKWTDEQRIDNCNVPPDKRGAKPRPSVCPLTPSS